MFPSAVVMEACKQSTRALVTSLALDFVKGTEREMPYGVATYALLQKSLHPSESYDRFLGVVVFKAKQTNRVRFFDLFFPGTPPCEDPSFNTARATTTLWGSRGLDSTRVVDPPCGT